MSNLKINKKDIGVGVYPYERAVCLPGVEYIANCPDCGTKSIIDGMDYFLSQYIYNEDFEWCSPTFSCSNKNCKLDWEEEFKLKITFNVELVE